MKYEQLYMDTISKFGHQPQMIKTIEECAELQKAFAKLLNNWNEKDYNNAIEEIADVQIMIDQMKLVFGIEAVRCAKKDKIKRLKSRVYDTTELPTLQPTFAAFDKKEQAEQEHQTSES